MIKYCFTTVASCDCLYKLIILYRSIYFHHKDFRLFVLCADEQSYKVLAELNYDCMVLLKLESVEDGMLKSIKKDRSFMEYCWTLKSVVLNYVINNYKEAVYYAHVDSDLCFFGSTDCLFEEAPSSSIFFTDHNNSNEFLYTYETSGRYNSGFVGFSNDSLGRYAANWWMERCLDWCYVTADVEKKLYGDQRYLEWMCDSFSNIHVINNKGANAAHWNIKRYNVNVKENNIYLDDDRLVFYHFSGFTIISPDEFNLSWLTNIDQTTLGLIYLPYMLLLSEEMNKIQKKYPGFDRGMFKLSPDKCMHYYKLK